MDDTTPDVTPFDALLRACLRWSSGCGSRDTVAVVAQQLADDPGPLRRVIESERVGPLLHRAIGELDVVPPAAAAALRQSYHVSSARNALLRRELGACLRALAAAGVPVIVLKGAALAETVYPDAALRALGDLDLLIAERDLASARQTLQNLGHSFGNPETHAGNQSAYENELVFYKTAPMLIMVDVHWSLFDSPYYQERIAMEWFWETARPASIAGVSALVLGPEALLMHLCGHLVLHHHSTGLLWWHDIAAVLTHYRDEIDWPRLLGRAEAYGLLLPVGAGLTRCADEWGAPVPPDVLRALRARAHPREELRVFARLTAVGRPLRQRLWGDLIGMRSWRRRLRFVFVNLFPSPAYMRERYAIAHPLLLPLYYPYRWLLGLRRR